MNRRNKRGSARGWLAQAVAVLALVLFAAVPVAEAATCGSEPQRGAQAFDAGADVARGLVAPEPGDESPTGGFKHADACVHGHCHHTAVPAPAQTASDPGPTGDGALLHAASSRAPPTIHPAFPKRPPRV